jgi:uncharacterized membrane protein
MSQDSHIRSVAKAISWRATGTVDTFVLSFLITGSAKFAGSIAATEVITKIALFYGHERVWAAVRWGRTKVTPDREQRPQMTVSLDRRHCPVCTPAT